MTPRFPIPGFALALSGGAVRGIAHIAVIDALEREGVPIHAVAGTSAGSVIGSLYAAGMPLSAIKRLALTTTWKDVFKLTIPKTGLVSSEGIERFMNGVLPVKKFSSLPLPFAAVATDLQTGEKVDLAVGSIARAVRASCSLPIIFTPTEINRRFLVDGGVVSQVPVRTARERLGVKLVIAVNVNYRGREADCCDNLISIATHLSALWASRNAREEEKLADVVIQVDATGIPLYDLSKARELLRRGALAVERKLPEIRRILDSV